MDIQRVIALSEQAAKHILAIYHQSSFSVSVKNDKSFLTQADLESHAIIYNGLKKLYPAIPVISEESTEFHDYAARKNQEYFFLVDPLDGTKEFVNRNGEFTINIALIHHNQPILGIINAPALNVIYYAEQGKGAYKMQENKKIKLPFFYPKNENVLSVVVSRSHFCKKTAEFIARLKSQGKQVNIISAGSALKFGLIAEGQADLYPRFTPTMEWDTAAGHILVNETHKSMMLIDSEEPLQYNKIDLKNSAFIVR